MTDKILSKNILLAEFNARKLQFVANRIQIFHLDKKGAIQETCDGIWKISEIQKDKEVNFFELFEAFQIHKEVIDVLFTHSEKNLEKDPKSVSINNIELTFEEEIFFVDVLFTFKSNIDKLYQNASPFLESLIEDKTDYYTSLKNVEEKNKLQEIEFLNEKWQLTKDKEFLEVNHQKELLALNEQLRLNWTNLLANNLKKTATQNFIDSDSNSSTNFENLIALSNSFEKISGIHLFPQKIDAFLATKNPKSTFSYLGKNTIHLKLIQKLVELSGANFIDTKVDQDSEFDLDLKEINFIFIEQSFIIPFLEKNTSKFEKELISSCLLVEPSFLEKEQHLINNKTNLLIYPLYPFQIWQQLLSFTNTTIMSYNEKIDLSQIYEIVDNEPVLVQSMLQILDKNLREYPTQLQQEFNDGQLDTLRQTVHKFKSCTAYTGLTEFNDTLSEIELSQENGWTIAQIKDKLEFVLQAIPVIKVQVEAKLRELQKEMS